MSVIVHDRGPTWSFPLSMMHASCGACDEWHSHKYDFLVEHDGVLDARKDLEEFLRARIDGAVCTVDSQMADPMTKALVASGRAVHLFDGPPTSPNCNAIVWHLIDSIDAKLTELGVRVIELGATVSDRADVDV